MAYIAQNRSHLSEANACIRLLAALPPSYSSFVISQNAVLRLIKQVSEASGVPEYEMPRLDINELVGALMQEEASRQTRKSDSKSQDLVAAKVSGKPQRK